MFFIECLFVVYLINSSYYSQHPHFHNEWKKKQSMVVGCPWRRGQSELENISCVRVASSAIIKLRAWAMRNLIWLQLKTLAPEWINIPRKHCSYWRTDSGLLMRFYCLWRANDFTFLLFHPVSATPHCFISVTDATVSCFQWLVSEVFLLQIDLRLSASPVSPLELPRTFLCELSMSL